MSFETQENLLLDLLFDHTIRQAFINDATTCMQAYSLTNEEQEDFLCIRPEALIMDANMRTRIVLGQLCKALPISFSLYSSIPDGLKILPQLISSSLMKQSLEYRPVLFADKLIEKIQAEWFSSTEVMHKIIQVINVEKALAHNKHLLRQAGPAGRADIGVPPDIGQEHLDMQLALAPFVTFADLPLPHSELKKSLCPKPDAQLWAHLQQHPLPASMRDSLLEKDDPRLLISRAVMTEESVCDPVIDHFTAELSPGFSNILSHLEDKPSINKILAHMQHAGADIPMLQSIQNTLIQLVECGLLIFED